MGEYLPDGSYQSYHTICPECGKEVKVNIQGTIFDHKCKQAKPEST